VNSPLLGYTTVCEALFSVSSGPSSCGTAKLCNPFRINGWVNAVTSATIETVFSVGSVQSAYERSECNDRIRSGAVTSQS
jgi:hypothetical protein